MAVHSGVSSYSARRGFAITVVLLVTVVALGAFVFSAALLGLSSRSSASQERAAAQAFLAADSGLATFEARVRASGVDNLAAFEEWVADLDSLLFGDVSVDLEALRGVDTDDGRLVTVRSVATDGVSNRTLLAEFLLEEQEPGAIQLSVPAALTSYVTINAANNTAVLGLTSAEDQWIFDTKWVVATNNKPVQVSRKLSEAYVGDHVRLVSGGSTQRFEVVPSACADGELGLRPVAGGEPVCRSGALDATVVPFAATSSNTVSGTQDIEVTPGTFALFPVGAEILVGSARGEIVSASRATGTLTVEWASGGFFEEGDPIRMHVPAGMTDGACVMTKADFDPPCVSNETPELSDLMQKTFGEGATEADLRNAAAEEHGPDDPSVFVGTNAIAGVELSGWTFLDVGSESSGTGNNLKDLRGEGILVIRNTNGSSFTLNVDNGFRGLIYVIGEISLRGNALSTGAVVVDGTAYVEDLEPTDGDTAVTGGADIRYDPLALLSAIRSIGDPRSQPFEISSVAGSTRIR